MIRILILALALTLAACDKTNKNLVKNDDQQLQTMLVKGKTTKAEVESMFGKPNKIEFDNHHHEEWIYSHGETSINPMNFIPITKLLVGQQGKIRTFIVVFDKGVVIDAKAKSENGQVKEGLLN